MPGRPQKLFEVEKFDKVVNHAAQAGVRYSITNPYAYMQSNMVGFLNILEACRNFNVKHLIYASSSSVYGLNSKVPYSEDDKVDSPVSLYAASKKSNERQRVSPPRRYSCPCNRVTYTRPTPTPPSWRQNAGTNPTGACTTASPNS